MIPKLPTPATPTIEVTVTRLALEAPPAGQRPACPPPVVAVGRAHTPPVHFYRYLYNTVGENWLWSERRALADPVLAELLADPRREVYIFWREGSPHGFSELMRHRGVTEIVLFGLMPHAIGQRTGPFLLRQMIDLAWSGGTTRVEIETCSLDHPKALRLYQRAGFEVFQRRVLGKPDPRLKGMIPRDAAPHVPLADGRRPRSARRGDLSGAGSG